MTRQMARGAQVAFGKSWLERQNIESQTVDVHSHIDSSLSYEENIKKMKRMLGMGGRSTQQATRTMSAGECDVAIGNYEAGYNGTTMKEACECGHPDACEDIERKKAKAAAKPKRTPAKSKIEKALSKLRTLDAKERELKFEERALRQSQPVGQESSVYGRLLDKITDIQAKKAKIWNNELRKTVIPETGKTMWQMAIASKTLPVNFHGQENLLQFTVPDLLAAIKSHISTASKPTAKPKPKKTPTPKAKPKTTSGTVDKFRQLLIKHPDRRAKTIERMKGVLASHTLGRDFGGSMEDYYKQRPDLKRTDEGLQALITEAGRGTVKATPTQTISPAKEEYLRKRDRIDKEQFEKWGIGAPPTPRLPPLTPPAAAPKRKPPAAKPKKAAKPKPKAAPKRKAAAKKKTAAKPAKAKPPKTAAAAPKLTAAQRKRLNATGRITVKRNGKFITITKKV